jgi:enoyl-CoA hydratase/carnithine racemase
MGSVDFEVSNFVGHITINHPEKRNAVSSAMAAQLHEIYSEVEKRSDVRVAIISGAGDEAFCVGGYIPEYVGKVVGTDGSGQRTVLPKPWRIAKPFIAAIEGYCVGGGIGLALSCDLRVAGDSAVIGASGLKRGLVNGATVTSRLVRVVGLGNALEALLTSEYMPAEKAERIGLVQRVVPRGSAREAALKWAETIAQFSPEAVAGTKRLAYDNIDLSWDEALTWEEAVTAANYRTPDAEEGFTAFLERREPVFGRNSGGGDALGLDANWPRQDVPEWRS